MRTLKLILSVLMTAAVLSAQHPGLAAFKKQINFDSIISNINDDDRVYFEVPDLTNSPFFDKTWTSWGQSVHPSVVGNGRGVHAEYHMQKGGEGFTVDYYYFDNLENAKSALLGEVSNTQLPFIPYKLGPKDVGDISFAGFNAAIFLKSNLCVTLHSQNSAMDLWPICRWIQSRFNIISSSRILVKNPKFSSVSIPGIRKFESSELQVPLMEVLSLKAGNAFDVKPEIPSGADGAQILVEEWWDRNRFDVYKHDDCLTVRGNKPGNGKLKLLLINRKTLLFSVAELTIEVQP